ncbi:mitochondrial ribosomal death-associated protein 3-domain-containing protein [Amylostereum chailletii]|nr:mitochondrial ribosomal death-associated protein 3-domain-containing protein [Amylostereum chailletii]
MSLLSAATRARTSLHTVKLASAAGPSALQSRGYAAPKKAEASKKMRQGFRAGGKDRKADGTPAVKREKRLGVFRPMSANQLNNPIFQADTFDELTLLPTFHSSEITQGNIGKALSFPLPENDVVRIFGVPRNLLVDFRVLSKPTSVIRDVTVQLVDKLQAAGQGSSKNSRTVLAGDAGSGKSYLLLQAVEYAASSNWIVMYFPRAVNLVNSSTNYSYDLRTQTYLQPVFAYQTLQRFLTVNAHAISSLRTQAETAVEQGPPVPAGTSLADLIEVGLKDKSLAPSVLTALMAELGKQTEHPVLLAIDDFQALLCKSAYRDPHFSTIKSWHLSMPRLLLDYVSGKKTFARGAVIGALSSSNTDFKLTPELRHALGLQPELKFSPFKNIAPEYEAFTAGVQTMIVPSQLKVEEAASLFEVWMKNRSLHTPANDEFFMSKFAESGGNARDFVWRGLLGTLQT